MGGRPSVPMTRVIGTTALAFLLGGCYTMQPVGRVVPDARTKVAFDITDAGRVALGSTMVPEIDRIEGRVLSAQDSSYLVAVSTVRLLRGSVQVWSGEQVRVNPQHVSNSYIKRFDRTRSVLLGVAIVGGAAAILVTRSIIGSGNDDPGNGECCVETRTARPLLPLWRLTPRGAFP